MKEKTLLRIALICSLLGLLSLYLISENINIEEKNIEKITLENKDEFVKLKGTVTNVVNAENVMIIDILQPQEITVVMFKSNGQQIGIKKGQQIEVIGKVDDYEGNLEIIADRVRVIP
jgi:DNA/RNA endonuclease YhcR with UshA esterase domain